MNYRDVNWSVIDTAQANAMNEAKRRKMMLDPAPDYPIESGLAKLPWQIIVIGWD